MIPRNQSGETIGTKKFWPGWRKKLRHDRDRRNNKERKSENENAFFCCSDSLALSVVLNEPSIVCLWHIGQYALSRAHTVAADVRVKPDTTAHVRDLHWNNLVFHFVGELEPISGSYFYDYWFGVCVCVSVCRSIGNYIVILR